MIIYQQNPSTFRTFGYVCHFALLRRTRGLVLKLLTTARPNNLGTLLSLVTLGGKTLR
jgi:hypothetical protein